MLTSRWIPVFAILALASLLPSRAFAWNSTGHELVAQIAYDQLTPAVRTHFVAILRNHPRLKQDLLGDPLRAKDDDLAIFLRAATWPDMVRSPVDPMFQTENHPRWHYVDLPILTDGISQPAPNLKWNGHGDPENLVQAMQKATSELKNPATAKDRQAIDVCWVEHLVGDIHQPLHATSWFSKEFPRGDKGGNMDFISVPNQPVENLHFYWDAIEGMSMDPSKIRKIADRIEAEHPPATLKDKVADLSIVDWAQESLALAKGVAYENGSLPHAVQTDPTTRPATAPALPEGYAKESLAVGDERIALAGYRLAALLTQLAAQ